MAEKERKFKVGDYLYAVSFINTDYDERSKQHPVFSFTKMEILLVRDGFIYMEPVCKEFEACRCFDSKVIKIEEHLIFNNFLDIINNDKVVIVSGNCWKHLEFCIIDPYETLNNSPESDKILGDLFEEYLENMKSEKIKNLDSKILSYVDIIDELVCAKNKEKKKYRELKEFVRDIRGDIMVKYGRFDPLFYRYYDNKNDSK